MSFNTDDTICAVASAPGGAGRGIVRVSGETAVGIASQLLEASDQAAISKIRQAVARPRLATILIDGLVSGVWKVEKNKTAATLVIEPFNKITKKDRAALVEEGEQLIRFIESKAKAFDIRFVE